MIAGEARVRDEPRETGARVPAPRVDGWKIPPAEKVRANVECRWCPGGAPSRGKRAKERDPMRSARVRPAWRFHDTSRKRYRSLARTLRGHRPALDALSARFPGRGKCRSEVRMSAPRPESRRAGSADGAHSRPRLPQKNRAGLWTHLCTTRIDRTNRQCATVSPAPASFRGAGASQLFPHRLKRNAALRRRDPVPFPAPPRPLTRAFARTSPFAA